MMSHPFDALTPDTLLDAVESLGLMADGRVLALNSYENRVFQIGLEESQPVVAKFYRPERWSREQILEEHAFAQELLEAELPVVAPSVHQGTTLHEHAGFLFALYPRRGGHAPELSNPEHLETLGRTLARLHNQGAVTPFVHRPALTIEEFGETSVEFLLEHFVPSDLRPAWESVAREALLRVRERCEETGPLEWIRVHGDCHVGNLLWRDGAPHIIDLDDARMAPAIQDLWMLLSGDRHQQERQLAEVLAGYSDFRDLGPRELRWIDALRTLRMLYFSAWIGRRWQDPAFPRAFPWFDSPRYWGEQVLALRQQLADFQEPVLRWL